MGNGENNVIFFNKRPQAEPHHWQSFTHPHQVVSDPALSADEKRSILAAWSSDAHAVESLPVLRHLPGTPFPVTFSAIMDAMAQLDRMTDCDDDQPPPAPKAIRPQSARRASSEAA